jgi:hypothetical protein
METSSMPLCMQLRTGITYVDFFICFSEAAPNEKYCPVINFFLGRGTKKGCVTPKLVKNSNINTIIFFIIRVTRNKETYVNISTP